MSDTSKQNHCTKKPCQSRPEKIKSDEVNSELNGRPVLYAGVVWIGIMRQFLIPSACRKPKAERPRGAEPPAPVDVSHSHGGALPDDGNSGKASAQPTLTGSSVVLAPGMVENRTLENGGRIRHSPVAEAMREVQQQTRWLSDEISRVLRDSRDIAQGYQNISRKNEPIQKLDKTDTGDVPQPWRALDPKRPLKPQSPEQSLDTVFSMVPRKSQRQSPPPPEATVDRLPALPPGPPPYTPPLSAPPSLGRLSPLPPGPPPDTPLPAPSKPNMGRPSPLPNSPALPAPPKSPNDIPEQTTSSASHQSRGQSDTDVLEDRFFDSDMEARDSVDTSSGAESSSESEDEDADDEGSEGSDQQHHPLNRKLSRYYNKKEEDESVSSLEEGYEDLYSNRK